MEGVLPGFGGSTTFIKLGEVAAVGSLAISLSALAQQFAHDAGAVPLSALGSWAEANGTGSQAVSQRVLDFKGLEWV